MYIPVLLTESDSSKSSTTYLVCTSLYRRDAERDPLRWPDEVIAVGGISDPAHVPMSAVSQFKTMPAPLARSGARAGAAGAAAGRAAAQ